LIFDFQAILEEIETSEKKLEEIRKLIQKIQNSVSYFVTTFIGQAHLGTNDQ
jgi:hypothetical protein